MKLCTTNPEQADCGCNKNNRMPDINISIQNNNESKADTGQRTTAAPNYAPFYAPQTNAASSYRVQPHTNTETNFPRITNTPTLLPTAEHIPIAPAIVPVEEYITPSSVVMPEQQKQETCNRVFIPLGMEWH